jgi:hypothetical protein
VGLLVLLGRHVTEDEDFLDARVHAPGAALDEAHIGAVEDDPGGMAAENLLG